MTVFAIACHPDDIEFMMSGTMFLLKAAGCDLHYMNLASGSCGTTTLGTDEIVALRAGEARAAADYIGAEFHESLDNDMEVLYTVDLLRRLTAVVRQVRPAIILTQSPQDYMEDHMNTSRLAVSAAFARGMTNFASVPEVPPILDDVAIYHAMPYGLCDQVRNPVTPHFSVNVTATMDRKREMLACHQSQKRWLDESQGLDSYLDSMAGIARDVGIMSGAHEYAEGWRQHLHLGYARRDEDPLFARIAEHCRYASGLGRRHESSK